MSVQSPIQEFLAQNNLAVVGVSGKRIGYGYIVYNFLKARGRRVFPVNPRAVSIDGEPCYPDLTALPENVDGAIIVVPPAQTEKVVEDAARTGIRRVWMQPGAESEAAVRFCEENGISVIYDRCIMVEMGRKRPGE